MRHYTVLENDIDLRQIWACAERAGFTDLRVALFNASPTHVSLSEFEDYLSGGPLAENALEKNEKAQLHYLSFHRLFFLKKAGEQRRDSRQIEGLSGKLDLALAVLKGRAGERLHVTGTVANDGGSDWLPASAKIGGVKIGVHLLNADGVGIDHDFARHHLTPDAGRKVTPGEILPVDFHIALPSHPGRYRLEFDLVSEGVVWFANLGMKTVKISVEVQ
jgi:hypothetical protein